MSDPLKFASLAHLKCETVCKQIINIKCINENIQYSTIFNVGRESYQIVHKSLSNTFYPVLGSISHWEF